MDQFETKLRAEIDRGQDRINQERARIEGLQQALDLYQQNAPHRQLATVVQPRSGSKFAFVLKQIERSGKTGMSIQEMMDAADQAGKSLKRSTIRSQLWHAKKQGQVHQIEIGRYVVVEPHGANGAEPDEQTADEGEAPTSAAQELPVQPTGEV